MSAFFNSESLDEEIKDLLQNYKLKKTTLYEPCTIKNYKQYLIGLREELSLLNINYSFNPHTDIENNTLSTEALVKLLNSVWTHLQIHKNTSEKVARLMKVNNILDSSNKKLIHDIKSLKQELGSEKNESRACVASAQRLSSKTHEVYQKLFETRAKLKQISKQKETNDKILQNKIVRLQLENDKITNRLLNKTDNASPCASDLERKQRAVIAHLQATNQDLLSELSDMKEKLILAGISNVKIKK